MWPGRTFDFVLEIFFIGDISSAICNIEEYNIQQQQNSRVKNLGRLISFDLFIYFTRQTANNNLHEYKHETESTWKSIKKVKTEVLRLPNARIYIIQKFVDSMQSKFFYSENIVTAVSNLKRTANMSEINMPIRMWFWLWAIKKTQKNPETAWKLATLVLWKLWHRLHTVFFITDRLALILCVCSFDVLFVYSLWITITQCTYGIEFANLKLGVYVCIVANKSFCWTFIDWIHFATDCIDLVA